MTLACARKFQKFCKSFSPRRSPAHLDDHTFVNLTGSSCSEIPAWKRLISGALTTNEQISLIMTIFSDSDQVEIIRNLSGDDAQIFVDTVDEVSSCTFSPPKSWHPLKLPRPVGQASDRLTPETRKECSRTIHSICGRQALLPRSLEIPPCYDSTEDPLCHGEFADVWKGHHQGREVAAKVFRVYKKNGLEQVRRVGCSLRSRHVICIN